MQATLEGRYAIFLFVVIYIFIIGFACSIFQPDTYALNDAFSDVSTIDDDRTVSVQGEDVWSAVTGAWNFISAASSMFFMGLTVNVPIVPTFIRVIMVTPVLVVFIIVLFEILLDIINGVKNFTGIFKPLG